MMMTSHTLAADDEAITDAKYPIPKLQFFEQMAECHHDLISK